MSVYSCRGDLGKDVEGEGKAEWEWKLIRTKIVGDDDCDIRVRQLVARKWRAHAQLNHHWSW